MIITTSPPDPNHPPHARITTPQTTRANRAARAAGTKVRPARPRNVVARTAQPRHADRSRAENRLRRAADTPRWEQPAFHLAQPFTATITHSPETGTICRIPPGHPLAALRLELLGWRRCSRRQGFYLPLSQGFPLDHDAIITLCDALTALGGTLALHHPHTPIPHVQPSSRGGAPA